MSEVHHLAWMEDAITKIAEATGSTVRGIYMGPDAYKAIAHLLETPFFYKGIPIAVTQGVDA